MPSSTNDDAARPLSVAELERATVDWLRTELEDADISASDNFLDVGGHSLAFARLNKFLADSFAVNLDMKVAYDEPLSTAVAKAQPVQSHA
ncbi:phosphopantetheine-binding protein [Streptomyces sp. NPDC049813]|uniref:phosphopantetheine-binding protein n=1 Tax=Streptomyces sp. NPDC049813 TaxID=3365597 RepID=UPI00379933EC